jgi:hypothetical protein
MQRLTNNAQHKYTMLHHCEASMDRCIDGWKPGQAWQAFCIEEDGRKLRTSQTLCETLSPVSAETVTASSRKAEGGKRLTLEDTLS